MAEAASAPSVITIAPAPGEAGQRLDKFLAGRIGTLSRSRVKSLILAGCLRQEGAVILDPAAPVMENATYTLLPPAPHPASPAPQAIQLEILFEDPALLVLNKPAGLVVHPAPGNQDGTLVNALLAHCGDSLTGIGGALRPGIVHRLDKDTSGLMVVAKTELAHTRLAAAFADREIDRAYQALCWGLPDPPAGSIAGDIGRDPRDRKRMALVSRNGKPALTNYSTISRFGLAAACLGCRLATGRTHQIRVHLASIGHPLIGDPVYLKRRPAAAAFLPAAARGIALDFPRQALHAATLGFRHPITRAPLQFKAPPPEDFMQLLHALQS